MQVSLKDIFDFPLGGIWRWCKKRVVRKNCPFIVAGF